MRRLTALHAWRGLRVRLLGDDGSADERERGFALVTVLGVMMVLALLATVVLAASTSSAGFATSRRASVQAQAAADAGVEALRAHLAKGDFVCSGSGTDPDYSFAVAYSTDTSSPGTVPSAACPSGGSFAGGLPTAARVVSTGHASTPGILGGAATDTARAGAVFALQPNTLLTDTIFSDGSLVFNGGAVNAAAAPAGGESVYTNGLLSCVTGGTSLAGGVRAQLGISGSLLGGLTGTGCRASAGDVWSGGDVSLGQGLSGGSVYASGAVSSAGPVSGDILAGGGVTLPASPAGSCPSSPGVGGSVYSLGALGGVTGDNAGSSVGGSVYARGPISLTGSGGDSAVCGSTVSLDGMVNGPSGGLFTPSKQLFVGGTVAGKGLLGGTSGTIVGSKASCASAALGIGSCSSTIPVPSGLPAGVLSGSPAQLGVTGGSAVPVQGPPYRSLPYVGSDISAWTQSGWLAYPVPSSWCTTTGSALGSDIDHRIGIGNYPPGSRVVLDFSACTGGVTASGANVVNNLSNSGVRELALFLPYGFFTTDPFTINAAQDGSIHSVYVVVPSNPGGAPALLRDPIDPSDLAGNLGALLGDLGGALALVPHPSAYVAWLKVPVAGTSTNVYKPICGALPIVGGVLNNLLTTLGGLLDNLLAALLGGSGPATVAQVVDDLNTFQQNVLSKQPVVGLLTRPSPDVTFGKVTTDSTAQLFTYTPCKATFGSGTDITGQIYAGMTALPSNLTVDQPVVGHNAIIPGQYQLDAAGADPNPYLAQVTSRYDVTG